MSTVFCELRHVITSDPAVFTDFRQLTLSQFVRVLCKICLLGSH